MKTLLMLVPAFVLFACGPVTKGGGETGSSSGGETGSSSGGGWGDGGTGCPDPNDPKVHYAGNSYEDPSICEVSFIGCDANQTPFSNECGCGCIDNPTEECPDPNDPKVHYVGDASVCAMSLVGCEPDQTFFTGPCGCGCIDPTCPDPNDPKVHYAGNSYEDPSICEVALIGCDPGQTFFTGSCGCGCIDPG